MEVYLFDRWVQTLGDDSNKYANPIKQRVQQSTQRSAGCSAVIWSTKIIVLLLSHQRLLDTSAISDAQANLWLGGLSKLPDPENRLLGAVAPLFHNSPPDVSHGDGSCESYENTCGAYRFRKQGLGEGAANPFRRPDKILLNWMSLGPGLAMHGRRNL
jgi:hypothetical protein